MLLWIVNSIFANWSNITITLIILYILRKILFEGTFTNLRKPMKGKIVIITGASAGVGKATALELLEDGAEVIFACRDKEKTTKVFREIEEKYTDAKQMLTRAHFIPLDLCSFKSVLNFVKVFEGKFGKLDILINNAATFPIDFEMTEDKLEPTIQTNYLSLVVLTIMLLDKFDKTEGRILNVSSFAHVQCDYTISGVEVMKKDKEFKSISDSYYGNLWLKHYHYANTKTNVIFFTSFLADFLEKHYPHIKAVNANPGLVFTEFVRFVYSSKYFGPVYKVLWFTHWYISKTCLAGAQTSLHLCYMDFGKINSGAYYSDCKLTQPSSLTKNKALREAVMDYTAELIKSNDSISTLIKIF